jgi:histidine triad (HIT) family protein
MTTVPGCVFCSIAGGETPASMVLRGDDVAAFLDARPVFKGHVLVVPRTHVPTLTDMPPADLGTLFAAVQRIARAVEAGLDADGTFVAMNNKVSQSVPHLHVHVVPRRKKDGLRGFFWPRVPYADDAEREAFAAKIRAALSEP